MKPATTRVCIVLYSAMTNGVQLKLGLLFVVMINVAFSMSGRVALGIESTQRPNVVMIVTDNHGAWTLGCYGNTEILTPNIDRLAEQGALFKRAYASNPVCSPTRATLLTGLIPSQHGVHCFLRGGRLQVGPDARNTLASFRSLPEILTDQGYRCGLVGKWHLGDNLRPQESLDDYWITMPHGATSTFYDAEIIEDGAIRREATYLTDFWTDHAVEFIRQQERLDDPFFMLLSYNGPYALGRLLTRDGRNRHAAYYADQELSSFPREEVHPWQHNNLDYINNPVSIRRVATEVSGVDDGVGRILDLLDELELSDNTVVILVADQGWVGGHGGFFGMGDHTRPTTARDGMMQIPMIWRYPGIIDAGIEVDAMVANYDVLPSLLSTIGIEGQLPHEPESPGRDFSDLLTHAEHRANSIDDWDNVIYYEFEQLRCIRTEQWKFVRREPDGPHELFDLVNDPEERVNLVDDDSWQRIQSDLNRRLNEFFDKYASPEYDLWNGGGSQTIPLVR